MTEYSNEFMETEIGFDAAPARLTVDLSAIVSNWRTMRALSRQPGVGAARISTR